MVTALKVSKAEAQQRLDQQIAEGRTIQGQDVSSQQALARAHTHLMSWREYTVELLRRLFDDDEPTQAFEANYSPFGPEPLALEGRASVFGEHMGEDIRRLLSLRNRVELMADEPPQAQTYSMLIVDDDLRRRCVDLLKTDGLQDRVIREACVVLEDRVRRAVRADKAVTGVPLMEQAFSPKGGPLKLSSTEQEQLGVMQLYRGTMAFFRNDAGHHLVATYTKDDARRFVAWIDLLLAMVEWVPKPLAE